MSDKKSPALAQVLQRLVLLRLFLPLGILGVIAIGVVSYSGEQTIESQQRRIAQSMARMVDRYLDQAIRTLDAVARVAEVSSAEDLANFMQSTWEAYGYFDTLYYLDAGSKITLLTPPNPRYLGLDMSNLPYFQQAEEKKNFAISPPFISLRTGDPTVYLVRQLTGGGYVVGELSLGSLQDEITHDRGASQNEVFIMDQSGMLLAHPSSSLVKQQTNQSYLEIFRRGLAGEATLLYEYAGTMVLGSAARVEQAGWVVVNQVPLLVSLRPYTWALGLTLLASIAIWLALAWRLRRQLEQHVTGPLAQLSRGTGALANGDFSQGKALAAIPAAFAELTALAADFQAMSDTLEARQAQLEQALRFTEALLSAIPTPVFYKDREGRYLGCNRAFSEIMGVSPEQIRGKTVFELWPGEHAAVYHAKDLELTRNPSRQVYEFVVRDKDGLERPVIYAKDVFRDEHDRVAGIVGAFLDITGRKQAEQALRQSEENYRRLNEQLEQHVLDRTAQLKAANEELEAFAYSVSHDLRAPLRHIIGYLKLLQEETGTTLDAQSQHYMANISDAARRMSILIDDLLSFSRMGRQEMRTAQVDIGRLAREVIGELEPETEGRHIHWQIAEIPPVRGDQAMLKIVLGNLLSNALKFTYPRQEAEIEIGCMPDWETEVTIFVHDNGVGFNMAYADRLFGVFQRLHRVDEFEGTGIGLANVRRIISRHGGRTWAEGEVDHGATFYFSLPLARKADNCE